MRRQFHLYRGVRVAALLALALSAGAGVAHPAQAQTAFADPAFQRNWERADKPVADKKADRSWYWGPSPGFSTMEPNKESPGGQRLVQYFDKARMEINDPAGDQSKPFYVTNGLLATELMSGRMQTGAAEFQPRCAAEIPLASDTDDANAPTYATFGKLMNEPKTNAVGQNATSVVNRSGTITPDPSKGSQPGVNLVYYEPLTGRNIPKVFWDFLNLNGPIYANGQYTTGPLNQPWFFASGLPVTDAYWANVKVAGKQVDVLIQAYERRVLTYIPAYNGSPFNVQMGNVGQHYYNWRYKGQGCAGAPPPAPSTPLPGATPPAATPTTPAAACDQGVPAATSATITPRCGPMGTVFTIHITGFQPGESISYWLTLPDGRVGGTPAPVRAGNHPGELDDIFDSNEVADLGAAAQGIWAITYQGAASGHQSVVWFRLTAAGGATPTPAGATPGPGAACDTTGTKDASVSPTSGPKGTVFRVTVTGFEPGEQASFWLTDPDGAVFGSTQTLKIPDSGGGTLPINSGVLYPGTWALTIHGLHSAHESVGKFCVSP